MNERLNKATRLQEEFAVEENIQNMEQMDNQGEGTFINEEQPIEEDMISMEQPQQEEIV